MHFKAVQDNKTWFGAACAHIEARSLHGFEVAKISKVPMDVTWVHCVEVGAAVREHPRVMGWRRCVAVVYCVLLVALRSLFVCAILLGVVGGSFLQANNSKDLL